MLSCASSVAFRPANMNSIRRRNTFSAWQGSPLWSLWSSCFNLLGKGSEGDFCSQRDGNKNRAVVVLTGPGTDWEAYCGKEILCCRSASYPVHQYAGERGNSIGKLVLENAIIPMSLNPLNKSGSLCCGPVVTNSNDTTLRNVKHQRKHDVIHIRLSNVSTV